MILMDSADAALGDGQQLVHKPGLRDCARLARTKGAQVMTQASPGDPNVPPLIGELRNLLITGKLFEGINLHITQQDGWVQLHIMAVSIGSLGVLLATISDQAELGDRTSLSCRITPADRRFAPVPLENRIRQMTCRSSAR